MRHGLVGILALLVLSCDGNSDQSEAAVIAERCIRVRDHLVKLRLDSVAPQATPAEVKRASNVEASIREQHRAALVASLGDDFTDRCAQTMTTKQVDCVLNALDTNVASACSH